VTQRQNAFVKCREEEEEERIEKRMSGKAGVELLGLVNGSRSLSAFFHPLLLFPCSALRLNPGWGLR